MTKIIEAKMIIYDSDRVENILGNGENAGNQHFLLFPQCFQKASSSGSLTLSQASPGFYVSAVQVF